MLTCGLYRHEHANIQVNTSFKHQQLYLWILEILLMYFEGKHHNSNSCFYFSQRKPQKQIWTANNICTWSSFFFPARYSRFLLKSDSSNGSESLTTPHLVPGTLHLTPGTSRLAPGFAWENAWLENPNFSWFLWTLEPTWFGACFCKLLRSSSLVGHRAQCLVLESTGAPLQDNYEEKDKR